MLSPTNNWIQYCLDPCSLIEKMLRGALTTMRSDHIRQISTLERDIDRIMQRVRSQPMWMGDFERAVARIIYQLNADTNRKSAFRNYQNYIEHLYIYDIRHKTALYRLYSILARHPEYRDTLYNHIISQINIEI